MDIQKTPIDGLFVFTPVLWPDFGRADLESAIAEFQKRERRFGAVSQV